MKTCYRLVLLALALCLLMTSSNSIRMPRNPNPIRSQVNNDEKITISVKACKESKDCSSTSGNFRKLMTSSPITTSPKSLDKSAINVETFPPDRSQDTEYGDITEMDYSPAKRKPPIHN